MTAVSRSLLIASTPITATTPTSVKLSFGDQDAHGRANQEVDDFVERKLPEQGDFDLVQVQRVVVSAATFVPFQGIEQTGPQVVACVSYGILVDGYARVEAQLEIAIRR